MRFHTSFWLLMIFLLFGGGLLFSETVSVIIVETGVLEEAPGIESSSFWESGLMDVFFEHGHIVSNASMLRLNADQVNPYPGEQLVNIDEVREGGAAYYVLTVLNYSEENGRNAIPPSISIRLVQLYDGTSSSDETSSSLNKVLYEKQIDGSRIHNSEDAFELAKQTAESLIPYLTKKVSYHLPKMLRLPLFDLIIGV